MNNDIGNTLLKCCGEPEMPYIPGSALQSIINDAYKPDCDDRYEALQRQVEALDALLAALTEIAELDILKYHHAYAIAKGAIEEIEALKCSNS